MQQVFQDAYRANIWGDPESVSGPGSGLARTEAFRDQIPPLLEELGAGRLLYGRLAEADCVVASSSATVSSAGQKIFVRIPAEAAHLFSAETGARIEHT